MIALFDSGYGGMTVLKELIKTLPAYDYLYLGDNARAPYGGHSAEKIQQFSDQAVGYLFDRGAKLIITACNTVSSNALRFLQQKYLHVADERERKILGVLIPVAEKTVEISKNKKVGVVGTKATINAGSYEKEIHKLDPGIKVYGQACPLLVPFIEEAWHNKAEAISILKKYLRPLKSCNIDTLILGCTHYPLMHGHFQRIMGKKVRILNSGDITAEKLAIYLQKHPEIEGLLGKGAQREFLTTDCPENFQKFTEKYLGMKIRKPQKVELADYSHSIVPGGLLVMS